jgi:undecaprenyl-diphosphatase
MSEKPVIWFNKFSSRLDSLIKIIGLVRLIIGSLTLLIVILLFEQVLQGKSFAFDKSLLIEIYTFSNPQLDLLMLAITYLGNPSSIVTLFLLSFLLLWWHKDYLEAKIFMLASLGALFLNVGLKLFFTKNRPQLWDQLIIEKSFSFPSGHAIGSMVLYGFLGYLLANRYPKLAVLIYGLTTILILSIGFSRLYLGVHWPTDIIGGYAIGFLWLMACLTTLKIQKNKI